MLPHKRRIGKEYFEEIGARGVSFHGKFLSLRVLKAGEDKQSKFSFAVSKKVSNKAVDRNLLKRRGYSVVGEVLDSVRPSFLATFSIKKGAEALSFSEFREEMLFLLKKAGVLK